MVTTRFDSHFDLSRLPYFDLSPAGRLVLADPSFGPSIDCHTHFALAYALPMRVDLNRFHDRTEHYLPVERPVDLDLYMNKNFRPEDLRRLQGDLTWRSVTASGMRRTHTAANLQAEMADLGIAHSVVLPIELPLISRNAETYLATTRGREEFVCFGSVHPYEPRPLARIRKQKALGARGVKIHPAVQMVYPDDRRAMRVYAECGDQGLPVLWHCGPVGIEPAAGRRRSQVRRYEKPIAENPRTTFLLGHSGALQPEVALDLAIRYPNVVLELASQALPVIRTLLDKGPTDRIVMGSDWPFYHQATGLVKALLATEGDPTIRRRVLFENAARIFRLPAR